MAPAFMDGQIRLMAADRAAFTAVRSRTGAELHRHRSAAIMGNEPTPDSRAEGSTDIPENRSTPAVSTCLAAGTALRIRSAPRTTAAPNRPRIQAAGSTAAVEAAVTPAAMAAGDIITRALSSGGFTVAMDASGLPPFVQRTHKGWGTRSCVNTQLENAVAQLPRIPALPRELRRGKSGTLTLQQ